MKIVAIRLDNFGTGHYRITHPLLALQNLGHDVSIIQAEYGLRFTSHQLVADILWVQRMNDQSIYRCIEGIPLHLRPKVVYEIDDLVWDTHVKRLTGDDRLQRDLHRTVPPMIRMADAVTCSTPELAEECRAFNPNVYVIKNAIDFGNRNWSARINRPAEAEGKTVIGWSGSGWHQGDLAVIGKSLRDTLLAHPECHFIGQGDAPNLCQWLRELKLPMKRVSVIDWMPFNEHPAIYSVFDIGIAALASNPYNRCKSELRLMELGAKGVPYVASRVSPYSRFHCDSKGGCGFLAKTYDEWRDGLEALVCKARREKMGRAAYDFTCENYSLQRRGLELERVFKAISEGSNGQESLGNNLGFSGYWPNGMVEPVVQRSQGADV